MFSYIGYFIYNIYLFFLHLLQQKPLQKMRQKGGRGYQHLHIP
jgi:hypothetical protein